MVRHECAHVGGRDNLKRLLVLVSPAIALAALERAWTQAVEEAADAAAAAARPGLGLELAHALIHVARLAPVPHAPELASAFYRGGSIESRVRRLVADESAEANRVARPIGCVMALSMLGLLAAAVVLAAPALHQAMESFVSLLP
jgi:beta-lactamase regulating signal transducer with metallopeptidase domain